MSQSLSRGLELLTLLGERSQSLDELADSIGVHKTTVLRLLRTMEEHRFVWHDREHRYHLGARLSAIGDAGIRQQMVKTAAAGHLRDLSNRTGGQAVHLAILEGENAVYLDKVESTHAVRMYSRVGLPAPLHATGVGKVLLAGRSTREREAIVAGLTLTPLTDRTLTTPSALLAELERVAERGWAEDAAEHETFINCIAAGIHDEFGQVVAAVSISVPDVILDHEGVVALLPELLRTVTAIDDVYAASSSNPTPQLRKRSS